MSEIKMSKEEFDALVERAKEMPVATRILEQFIDDMRAIGQTEMAAKGPGYEISFKIERKEPQ